MVSRAAKIARMLAKMDFGSDPVVASRFIFIADDVLIGSFNEVSGLGASIEVVPIAEGGQNEFVHQRPAGITWNNITLKRGVTDSEGLYQWLKEVSGEYYSGNGDRFRYKSCVILALEPDGGVSREWAIYEALPVRWTGPTFSADSNEAAVEELEIAHHGLHTSTYL